MNSLLLIMASLVTGLAVSYFVTTEELVLTCLPSRADALADQGKQYTRTNRGFPLHFSSTSSIPACSTYSGPACAVEVCQSYPGLQETGGINPTLLALNVAVWSLAAGGLLYIASALMIRT